MTRMIPQEMTQTTARDTTGRGPGLARLCEDQVEPDQWTRSRAGLGTECQGRLSPALILSLETECQWRLLSVTGD